MSAGAFPAFPPHPLAPRARAALERLDAGRFVERLAQKDPTPWSVDPAHHAVARSRLGWLDAPGRARDRIAEWTAAAREAAGDGFTHAVLLGMGGSSLAPEVLRLTFGARDGFPDLAVLDNTSPAAVRAVMAARDPLATLFVVASKSGRTAEVAAFEATFFEWVRAARGRDAGRSFLAITDPGTPLDALAAERGYRRVFHAPPDVGGRYSALTEFGLVPAALMGLDLEPLVAAALAEQEAGRGRSAAQHPGVALGAWLGALALEGRDKLTLVLGAGIAAFASWIEQLVAESTGKDGRGILPVAFESLPAPEACGADRVFVACTERPFPRQVESRLEALAAAGHPVIRWTLPAPAALGGEFLRWEIATAAAAAVLGVDPFDEPNVTEAKQATRAVLDRSLAGGGFAAPDVVARAGGLAVECPAALLPVLRAGVRGRSDAAAWLHALLGTVRPGDYVALLAYLHATPPVERRLEALRHACRDATRAATTLGIGPRFLHSTGQLHKGGPATGVFVQLVAGEGRDVPIPGERFGFAALRHAQAAGDYEVLTRRGRRVLRVHLEDGVEAGLDALTAGLGAARV